MSHAITVCFVIVGLINVLPLMGVVSDQQLQSMYGVSFSDPNMSILLKHRAVLFGLLGGYILYAAWVPKHQMAAFVLGFGSMLSFLLVAWTTGGFNQAIQKVVVVDIVGIVVFIVAAVLYSFQ